ncbi:hypothetical protein ACFLZO_00150 [Patescibacteria group bacterium]
MDFSHIVLAGIGILLCTLFLISFSLFFSRVRRNNRAVSAYQETLPLLHCMVVQRGRRGDALAIASLSSVNADYPIPPDMHALYDVVRDKAARLLSGFSDEEISAVSDFIARRWLRGERPAIEVEAFLKEERELLKEKPFYVGFHFVRFIRTFGSGYMPSVKKELIDDRV